ncbi:hypothetical protein [Parablautia muri]|uniref:Uncharacterized protein n=1 Tax=Parablautia muri TaxID=2320879 RepID=A0A9X5BJX2_9FIRM|nr:hypothetical protein [Parablautia muri]NBJ95084.1 hypothetical protein [Parablautia muri]
MRFIKKFTAAALAVAIVFGGFGISGNVAQARDIGDVSKYCTMEQYRQLAAVDAKAQKITQLINDKTIGCHDSGSSWEGTEKTRYWLTESQIDVFWNTANIYLFPVYDSTPSILHTWGAEGLLKDVDNNGVPNWTVIDGVTYLTSINCDEVMEVINEMSAVLFPFQPFLQAEWERKNGKERKEAKSSGGSHTHNYVETIVEEATADTDRIVALECTPADSSSHML